MTTDVATKPEILETPDLELTIESKLTKGNVTDAVIAALEEKYAGLILRSIDDKEMYLEIKEARKETRKVAIIAEKICKAGREDAVKIQKLWLSKESAVVSAIEKRILDKLDAQIKIYEDEEERKEAEEIKRQEEEYMNRQTALLKMEAKYIDGCFTLGNVSYEINNIKESPLEVWTDTILPKYKREFEKIEAVRAEEERIKEEAAEKLRQEQAAFAEQQRVFQEQQQAFKLQQDQLQEQQAAANRLIEEQKNKVRDARSIDLRPYIVFIRDYHAMLNMEESAYQKELSEIKVGAEQKWESDREDQEVKQAEALKIATEKAAREERERIEEEQRLTEVRNKQLEAQRQEDSAKASDKNKWALFISVLTEIELPTMNSTIYKSKLAIYKEKLSEIKSI